MIVTMSDLKNANRVLASQLKQQEILILNLRVENEALQSTIRGMVRQHDLVLSKAKKEKCQCM